MKKIEILLPCEAFISTGFFESNSASLQTKTQKGIVTEYDENSHYVKWEINGISQPIVNINSIGFIIKKFKS